MKRTIKTKLIKCPICKSSKFQSVYRKTFNVCINNIELEWPTTQVICEGCGAIYTNPQPDENTLKFYYEKHVRYIESSDQRGQQRIKFLNKNVGDTLNTILDIGAYDGMFLSLAKNEGFKIFGIEPSIEGVKKAKEKYDIELEKEFFDKNYVERFLKSGRDKFDIVCFFHVYEHIQDPINFLNSVRNITKPNGLIFIEVPDAGRPIAGNIADFFSIEHIMHYTETSLKNIALVVGLEIVAIEKLDDLRVIRVILRNTNPKSAHEKIMNEFKNNKKIIEKYKMERKSFLNSIKDKLRNLNKIVIYGAGMHTSQMLHEGLLNGIDIAYIIDSNKRKWGGNFFNYTVSSPEILKNCKLPVLISSYASQEEISNFISKNYPNINQIKLYDKVISYNKGMEAFGC